MSDGSKKPKDNAGSGNAIVPGKFLYPFILVTSLFALWGFANDITNPLVKGFKDIFQITNEQSSWVQRAFYGGYATMAIPAALVLRVKSYKWGIIIGLLLLCDRCTVVHSGQLVHAIFDVPGSAIYPYVWLGVSGNRSQPVHPFDGFTRNRDSAFESRPGIQPNRIANRHVDCGDIHPAQSQHRRLSRRTREKLIQSMRPCCRARLMAS